MPGGDKRVKSGIAEAQFVVAALKQGWEVAKPISDTHPYDFLLRRARDEPWQAVQVKAVYIDTSGNGGPRRVVTIRRGRTSGLTKNRMNKVYVDGDFDLLFCHDDTECWLIPWSEVRHLRSLVCPDKFTKYKITG